MGTAALKLAVCALIVLGLGYPPGLAGQERRGADLVVTRLDGIRVSGELIAVKPDSLLLLSPAGLDVTIRLAEIRSARIVKRPPIVLLTAAGFLLASGAVGMTTEPLEEWGWAHAGLAGILGGAAGLVSGLIAGHDRIFHLVVTEGPGGRAGATSEEMTVLSRLALFSRVSREGREAPAERRPRLRLGLATTMGSFDDRWKSLVSDLSWRFTESVPPGEAGPQTGDFVMSRRDQRMASPGPFSLGYEWTEHWIPEVEISLWTGQFQVNIGASPGFVSTADGRTYTAHNYYSARESAGYLLVGMAYRPIAPSSGRKASVEVSVAAGPAWVKIGPFGALLPADNKTALAARVQAAYDFSFTRSFSLGVYAGYRHLEVSFPGSTVTQEMTFTAWPDPVEPMLRQVEMTVPAKDLSRSGFIYGLRFSFRI